MRARVGALDGLRTLAVALVFAHHVNQGALPGGFLGVDVFFVLSGYLISSLLFREQERSGTIAFKRFYVRRSLRLWPALIAMVVVVTVVSSVDGSFESPLLDAGFSLTYLYDFYQPLNPHVSPLAHTWSLSVEEQFYLVWPVLLLVLLRRRLPLIPALAGLSVVALALTGAFATHYPQHIQMLPTTHLPQLAAGIAIAYAVGRGSTIAWATQGLAAAGLVALVAALFFAKGDWWPIYPLATVACAVVVAHLATRRSGLLVAAFEWMPLRWFGERSYGFYLWHYPALLLLATWGVHGWAAAGVGFAVTLALTLASWTLVEQPFLRIKDGRQRTARRASVAE
jgi:peptidoglycan/LPS O-acetylase OafA/YrhL